jgi:hypothetical protein
MNNLKYRITLDLLETTAPIVLKAMRFDTKCSIIARLTAKSSPFPLGEGIQAVLAGYKPDGTTLFNDCTILNDTIIYDFTQQTTTAVGVVECEFKLYTKEGNPLLTSPRFSLLIENTIYDEHVFVDSTDEHNAFASFIKDLTDDHLSETSENPVQNKVITEEINNIKRDLVVDDELSEESEKAVQNKVIAAELKKIKQVLTADVDAKQIIFPDGLKTTYDFGKIKTKNGEVKDIIAPGGTLAQVFEAFVDEMNPSTVQPSASITLNQAGGHEVGTEITPTYTDSFSKGSYTYDDDTGVTETSRTITDSNGNNPPFAAFTVGDSTSYKLTVVISHTDGIIPHTNMGNEYSAGQIKAGDATATSKAVTGYRNTFYGTLANKNALTSEVVRGLTKSGKALANGSTFDVTIPVGALRVVIAYPSTLRDVSSIKDVNGLNAEIASGFTKQTLSVEGANSYTATEYKVYTMDFASANDKANQFTVTI